MLCRTLWYIMHCHKIFSANTSLDVFLALFAVLFKYETVNNLEMTDIVDFFFNEFILKQIFFCTFDLS